MTLPPRQAGLPQWIRWVAFVWLALWVTAYWRSWGPTNFLHFCDIAEALACAGFLANSALLISSQATASLLLSLTWALDAGSTLVFGRHPIGGTEYMWDTRYPLWIRLLSLFHLVLPVLLLWALSRMGYDRRGLAVQSAIALPAFIASRFVSQAENMNYAYADPFFHRAWGPAPVHIAVIFMFMVLVVYLPTHALLKRIFPRPQSRTS